MTNHCLSEGDDHVEHAHVKLMLDCIAACTACADFISRNSNHQAHYCKVCAEICKACADSCEKVGNMDECVDYGRDYQESCAMMAS